MFYHEEQDRQRNYHTYHIPLYKENHHFQLYRQHHLLEMKLLLFLLLYLLLFGQIQLNMSSIR